MLKTEFICSLILSIFVLFFSGDMSFCVEHQISKQVNLIQVPSITNTQTFPHNASNTTQERKQYHTDNSFFIKASPVIQFFAGIAAILGIIYPLGVWWYGRKPPFKIKSVTVFENKTNGKASYAFIYENRKNHPVTIYETNIYFNRFYLITESIAHSVTISGPVFTNAQRVLSNKTKTEVPAHGSQPIIMSGGEITQSKKLFIHLHTSNGYQTIKCRNIEQLIVDEVELYHNMYDISSFFKAKIVYYGLKCPWFGLRELVKKYAEQWKWGNNNQEIN